jgi:hypothetical protein
MESVGSFEAKTHLPQLLERVAKGKNPSPEERRLSSSRLNRCQF